MANHKSAKKRARQSLKRRDRNKSYISGIRTAVKNFRVGLSTAVDSEKTDESVEGVRKLLVKAQSSLQRGASKGMIHRNNASRMVSRLTRQFKSKLEPAPKA